jgi:acetoin utilization deacetylase AcuC-like enzyme
MLIFANPHHARHSARHEMYRGRLVPVHEVPARLDFVLAELARRPVGELRATPPPVTQAQLERVHARRYLEFLKTAWAEWVAMDPANAGLDALPSVWPVRGFRADVEPDNFAARMGLYSFDAGTPLVAGTWTAVETGAACAVAAAQALWQRGPESSRATMALTRPPGHHAGHDFFGGYCFLNNAAIAAQTLRDQGAGRVAVLDVDYHHGNGTQSLFYDRRDVLTVSIHGDPRTEYPFYLGHADESGRGEGEGCNLNLPLPTGTGFSPWRAALMHAMQRIADYGPDALVVALGVDTFVADPISGFRLASEDYLQVGRDVASMRLPTVFTLEGGYAVEAMGVNVVNVLDGFCGAPSW